jgi:hypothetical protein
MKPQLQRLEVEALLARDDELAVERAPGWELAQERLAQLRKVAVERLLVAALDVDLVAIAKDQRAEAVPLRLEEPAFALGSASTRLASMGRTGGPTGSCTRAILHGDRSRYVRGGVYGLLRSYGPAGAPTGKALP